MTLDAGVESAGRRPFRSQGLTCPGDAQGWNKGLLIKNSGAAGALVLGDKDEMEQETVRT